jgi:hypothetical protein
LLVLAVLAIFAVLALTSTALGLLPVEMGSAGQPAQATEVRDVSVAPAPTFTVAPAPEDADATPLPPVGGDATSGDLSALHAALNPGVVNIQVFVQQQGNFGLGPDRVSCSTRRGISSPTTTSWRTRRP